MKSLPRSVAIGVLLVGAFSSGAAGSEGSNGVETRLIVIQPGYPGSTQDATGFMKRLAEYLSRRASVPGVSALYHNLPDQALAAIRGGEFACGIVSPGFYLEHRKSLGLSARLEVLPVGRYHLVAPRGPSKVKPEDLVGKTVVGGVFYEREFVRRVVFTGVAGVGSWNTVPTLKITRALRKVERGRFQAAVLNEREFRTLEKLGRLKNLEKVFDSEYYPMAFFVVFEGATSGPGDPEPTGRLAAALRSMADNPEGKEILETMGCDGFRALNPVRLEKLEKRYDGETKRTSNPTSQER